MPGIVVFDATFLKDLTRPESIARIETACRTARLEISPSVLNVLEALKHSNPTIRQKLLDGLRRWTNNRPLNPWPLDLLRLAGEALPSSEFEIGQSRLDWLVDHPEALEDDHNKASIFLNRLQANFIQVYERNRHDFQTTLKATKQKYAWNDVGAFLTSAEWSRPENLEHLAGVLWELAGLPGLPPPLNVILRSEVWQMAMDAFGAATYVHAVKPNRMPNPPGFVDLMQLLYLTRQPNARILITDDDSLSQTANELLRGRYLNVRVLKGAEFLDGAV